jgi:hypothetical protein
LFGRDYNGNVCGEGVFVDMKYITYPRMEEDMMNAIINNISPDKVQFFGICVKSCPTTGEKTCTYDDSTCWTTVMDTENVLFRCLPFKSENETIISEECMDPPQAEPSCTLEKYLLKQCDVVCKTKRVKKNVWETSNTNENPLMDQLAGHIQTLGRFISDMSSSSTLILLVGGGGAILLGIIWLVALQFFAGCMIWLTCIFVVLVLVLVSLFCSVRSGIITQDQLQMLSFVNSTSAFSSSDLSVDTGNQVQFKVATYIMWGITGAILLLILAMKKHIHIAIAIIRESSSAIKVSCIIS